MIRTLFIALAALLAGLWQAPQANAQKHWQGAWSTNYGVLELRQNGRRVSGHYAAGRVNGNVSGGTLSGFFRNDERKKNGRFEFRLISGEDFQGAWAWGGADPDTAWTGERLTPRCDATDTSATNWAGQWDTTYDLLKLEQAGSCVTGEYPKGRVIATAKGNRLVGVFFNFPKQKYGRFSFTRVPGRNFAGLWRFGTTAPRSSDNKWGGKWLADDPIDFWGPTLRQSCRDCAISDGKMRCECETDDTDYAVTQLDLAYCRRGTVRQEVTRTRSASFGLACAPGRNITGTYARSCSDAVVGGFEDNGGAPYLNASCDDGERECNIPGLCIEAPSMWDPLALNDCEAAIANGGNGEISVWNDHGKLRCRLR